MIARRKIRPSLEIAIEFALVFFYIWYLEGAAPSWVRAVFLWVFCIGFPITCIAIDEKVLPEFSLDWRQFLRCLRWLLWFTLVGTIFLVSMALILKNFNYDGKLLTRFSEYIFWAFLQQIGFQTFLTRRVHRVIPNDYASAITSSTLFALLHWPNPVLVLLTWIGGFFWSLSFIRAPNLYALSVSHGWLAVLTLYCSPKNWLHQLRIGPGYWTYIP